MDRDWIEQYAAGAGDPARAFAGLIPGELDARPGPGRWSIREVVAHLLDSDLVAGDRMKRVIALGRPAQLAYDQDAYVDRLGYGDADVAAAAELFRLHRLHMAAILRKQPDNAFSRSGGHSEEGPKSLADLVHGYVRHLEHHMDFVRRKREALGNPLPGRA